MTDIELEDVFTPTIIRSLEEAQAREPSPERERILLIVQARGLDERLRAIRRSWDAYVVCGSQTGQLDSRLILRLQDKDPGSIRGALAELALGYQLAKENVRVEYCSPSPHGPTPDMRLPGSTEIKCVDLEVKSKTDLTEERIATVVKDAQRQLNENRPNIACIVSPAQERGFRVAEQIIGALFGHEYIAVPIARGGKRPEEPRLDFRLDGMFFRQSTICTPSGVRRRLFSAVSALAILEPFIERRGKGLGVSHRFAIFHNPFAENPLMEDLLPSVFHVYANAIVVGGRLQLVAKPALPDWFEREPAPAPKSPIISIEEEINRKLRGHS